MMRRLGLGWACAAVLGLVGCSGSEGPAGPQGPKGEPGTGTPSVSAVTPSQAFLDRTLDLTIAGSGTSWSDGTTVTFTDPQIKVNKVTVASVTGLVVNVTIGKGATIGADDVNVTDAGATQTYKSAFQILEPIKLSSDQASLGVQQGGYVDILVDMLDITTPFDPSTTTLTLSNQNLIASDPNVSGAYSLDFFVQADVLEAAGSVDVTVTSNGVDSPMAKAFPVLARAPIALTSGMQTKGHLENLDDTQLYSYTPADASLRFVQLVLSIDNSESALIIPKSGKWSDAAVGFLGPYGVASSSMDLNYLVIGDSEILQGSFFGGLVPYDFNITFNDTKVTGVPWAVGNTDPGSAITIAALPGLVQGADLNTPGSMGATQDEHWYKITVAGSSAASPKTIHAATGGDPATDTVLDVYAATDTSTSLGTSTDLTTQEDLVVSGIKTDGAYFVRVTATDPTYFNPMDSTYDLFVEVK